METLAQDTATEFTEGTNRQCIYEGMFSLIRKEGNAVQNNKDNISHPDDWQKFKV